MTDCATSGMRFGTQSALEAAFDGGHLTSDGGLVWLAEADSELGLCERVAEHVPEWRKREGRHSLEALVKQRVFQIACGYEDQNDSDSLREDPLLKHPSRIRSSRRGLATRPLFSYSRSWRFPFAAGTRPLRYRERAICSDRVLPRRPANLR
jgi:Transposase DDE domain group 1